MEDVKTVSCSCGMSHHLCTMAMESVGKSFRVATGGMLDKIRNCIGLLNSMVNCGEVHSEISMEAVKEAMDCLNQLSEDSKEITGNSVLRGFTPREANQAILFVERINNGAAYGRNPDLCEACNLVKYEMKKVAGVLPPEVVQIKIVDDMTDDQLAKDIQGERDEPHSFKFVQVEQILPDAFPRL